MNVFFNYGVKLKHRELVTRYMASAMVCQRSEEAVELVKLGGTWLEHPPDPSMVYTVMGHFLDGRQPLVVRELAQAVREDWRMKVEPPLYVLTIEALLQLPEEEGPVAEALAVYEDAGVVGVRLPAPTHLRLLEACLDAADAAGAVASDDSDAATVNGHLAAAARCAEVLALDGHVRGGTSARISCALAWLAYRLEALPEAVRSDALAGCTAGGVAELLGAGWARLFEGAIDNFGCTWGFSQQLPRSFFDILEAAAANDSADATRLVLAAKLRLGRFYPASE